MASEKVRATVVETDDPRVKAGSILIQAPASQVFDLIANPNRHPDFDGSRTVKEFFVGPERLFVGAKFGMRMRIRVPYRITNTCIAFEEDRLISWRHFARHEWSYELVEDGQGQTLVIERFDGRPSLSQIWLSWLNAYENNQKAILKSLVRLKFLAENRS